MRATVEYVFGVLTMVFNAMLAWLWRDYFWQLLSLVKANYALGEQRPAETLHLRYADELRPQRLVCRRLVRPGR